MNNWQQVYASTRELERIAEIFWVSSSLSKQDPLFSISFHGFNKLWGYVYFTTEAGSVGEILFRDEEELLAILNIRQRLGNVSTNN